jgi:hypothetical protein
MCGLEVGLVKVVVRLPAQQASKKIERDRLAGGAFYSRCRIDDEFPWR